VSWLTEELVRRGHDVTLFASGDSHTAARLVPGPDRALRLAEGAPDPIAHHLAQLRRVVDHADEFDVIHNHMDYLGFPLTMMTRTPVVTTLHGRLDLPDLPAVFAAYRGARVISISRSQRVALPGVDWRGVVYHGLPAEPFMPGDGGGGYLAFLGRISIEKRLDSAIRVAEASGMPLKVAAKIDPADREYYRTEIEPMMHHPLVEYVGEIGDEAKAELLRKAKALLFPIDWPEPFGLVVIEALACGTPVIARRRGSVPELLEHGRTGFVCENEDEMVAAVRHLERIDRAACRAAFEARFTVGRMAEDYLCVYRAEIAGRGAATSVARHGPQAAPVSRSPSVTANGHAPSSGSGAAASRLPQSAVPSSSKQYT
jgi:glycosyltransferase involved in cell wall biosynthesis